ncbi:MAG: hypothetical protein HYR96_13105 [Deltaproteobacteria bacterium]|nr:hypothetical protein [Deltaproteobacteria bacterium]MBI3293938.1 hypothetical protein [Deltaproteobacteria bacterium]
MKPTLIVSIICVIGLAADQHRGSTTAGMTGLYKAWFQTQGIEKSAKIRQAADKMMTNYSSFGEIETKSPKLYEKMKPFLGKLADQCKLSLQAFGSSLPNAPNEPAFLTASTPNKERMEIAFRKLNNMLFIDKPLVTMARLGKSQVIVVDIENTPVHLRDELKEVVRAINADEFGDRALSRLTTREDTPLNAYLTANFAKAGKWENYREWKLSAYVPVGKSTSLIPPKSNNPAELTRPDARRNIYRQVDEKGNLRVSIAETFDRTGKIRRREVIEDVYDEKGEFQLRRVAARDFENGREIMDKGDAPGEKTTCFGCHVTRGGSIGNSFLKPETKTNVVLVQPK